MSSLLVAALVFSLAEGKTFSSYDYIVVGSGASGIALATTLGDKGKTLLVERGPHNSAFPGSRIKDGWPQVVGLGVNMQRASSGQWTGAPQLYGGGPALNGAACWRGRKELWREMGVEIEEADAAFNWVQDKVCKPAPISNFSKTMVAAWEEMGLELLPGAGEAAWADSTLAYHVQRARHLFWDNDGATRQLLTDNVDEHPNIDVMLHTRVDKILLDEIDSDEGARAYGIRVQSEVFGQLDLLVRRGGEIFLSAGAIETPKLLKLSGLGPRAELEHHGIEVIADLPDVGENLLDRKEVSVTVPMAAAIDGDEKAMLEFALYGPDAWISFAGKQCLGWGFVVQVPFSIPAKRTEECKRMLQGMMLFHTQKVPADLWKLAVVYVTTRLPRVKGQVLLHSSDPGDNAIVNDGWNDVGDDLTKLTGEQIHDLDAMVNMTLAYMAPMLRDTKLLENFGHPARTGQLYAESTREFLKGLSDGMDSLAEQIPECEVGEDWNYYCQNSSDCLPTTPALPTNREQLREVIFRGLTSSWHVQGSAQTGKILEPGTFKVKGVRSLRVSDLSAVGLPIDTHTMMTAMALGRHIGTIVPQVPVPSSSVFPEVLGLVLTIGAVLFSIAICVTQCCACFCKSKGVDEEGNSQLHQLVGSRDADEPKQQNSVNSVNSWAPSADQDKKLAYVEAGKDAKIVSLDGPPSENAPTMPPAILFENLQCAYPKKSGGTATVLQGVTGELCSSELIAIMGPSGCGKSTFMDILAGRKNTGALTGTISCFGQKGEPLEIAKHLRDCCAYIQQDVQFMPMQTTEEAVAFFAALRLGRDSRGNHVRMKRVRDTLIACGLAPRTHDRSVGGELPGGFRVRGLSGGEKKRLALACALATKPSVLFLDEITSGLDAENALLTVQLVKQICQSRNLIAVAVIHQPNPLVFDLFDRLILLALGRLVFSGKTSSLPSFYTARFNQNIEDFRLVADDLLKKTDVDGIEPWFEKTGDIDKGLEGAAPADNAPGGLWQLYIVFKRNLICNYVRNPINLVARVAVYGILSFADGAIFWQVADDQDGGENVLRAMTFIILISYLLPFATIPIFCFDKGFFQRESSMKLYRPWIYCFSQMVLELWVLVLAAFVEACLIVPMIGLTSSGLSGFDSFWLYVGILIISGNTGSSLVMIHALGLPTQDIAFALGSGVATLSLAVSGGFVPFPTIPDHARWLQWISPCKYTLQALSIAQFHGTKFEYILDLGELNQPGSIDANLGVLALMFVLFGAGSVIMMSFAAEKR